MRGRAGVTKPNWPRFLLSAAILAPLLLVVFAMHTLPNLRAVIFGGAPRSSVDLSTTFALAVVFVGIPLFVLCRFLFGIRLGIDETGITKRGVLRARSLRWDQVREVKVERKRVVLVGDTVRLTILPDLFLNPAELIDTLRDKASHSKHGYVPGPGDEWSAT
jgi:hypothetical protein